MRTAGGALNALRLPANVVRTEMKQCSVDSNIQSDNVHLDLGPKLRLYKWGHQLRAMENILTKFEGSMTFRFGIMGP